MRRRRARAGLKPLLGLAAVIAATAMVAAPSASARKAPTPEPTQELAMLLASHAVHSAPDPFASTLTTVKAFRPITHGQTVLPVIGRATTDGAGWLRVRIPGRPNGRSGWIKEQQTAPATTSWRLLVKTSTRRVLVYRQGRRVRGFPAIIGKPSTPTPRGSFFVEESVRMPPGTPGGPFALALSARSNVLQDFEGGPGQIAIHGVANLGGTPGTAVSHGCVRLSNRNISWIAGRVEPGAPVTITR